MELAFISVRRFKLRISTYDMPASPGSEEDDDAASADATTFDPRSPHAFTSNDNPAEFISVVKRHKGSQSSCRPFDDPTEKCLSSSRNSAVDKADARAPVSDNTLIEDVLSIVEEQVLSVGRDLSFGRRLGSTHFGDEVDCGLSILRLQAQI
jgi:hypothetical protein